MVAVAFFYSSGGIERFNGHFRLGDSQVSDLLTAAIDLALLFHCDPYVFLRRPPDELRMIYRVTMDRLREKEQENGR